MSLAWMILFAMVVEGGGRHDRLPSDHDRMTVASTTRALSPSTQAMTSRSCSVARKSWHRPGSMHGSIAGLDEFDTEEVDESWMVYLDAATSIPGGRDLLDWAWPVARPLSFEAVSLPVSTYFPLRC